MARSVSAGDYTPADHWGYFTVSITLFRPEDRDKAIQAVEEEIARIHEDGVTQQEVSRADRNGAWSA